MPLTPFAGLSVVIHIFVIFFFTIYNKIIPEKNKITFDESHPRISRVVSIGIIGLVFFIVILNAVQIVQRSLENEHSSLKYVGGAVESFETFQHESCFISPCKREWSVDEVVISSDFRHILPSND